MGSKKGIELALNTVVIMAILLLVTVVIIAFFLGATGSIFEPLAHLIKGGGEQINKSAPPIFQSALII
ncbi:TPA: hypothetical protein H1016_04695 [archaeon]|uniref:Uncharacterized protein n=1 Tax=Candidatus Naiadarchaeum limnaeum TaxID=2756139 RepID=A0A832V2F5_9ARCH|nr:hypothetical protein [Candidatus Naiadarchaeum limnaeum]